MIARRPADNRVTGGALVLMFLACIVTVWTGDFRWMISGILVMLAIVALAVQR